MEGLAARMDPDVKLMPLAAAVFAQVAKLALLKSSLLRTIDFFYFRDSTSVTRLISCLLAT